MRAIYLIWLSFLNGISFGQTLLSRQYDFGTNTQANALIQTTDGGYLLAGFIMEADQVKRDVLLIKTNADGDTTWTRTIRLGQSEEATCLIQSSDGGYYIGGNQFIINNQPIPSHFNWLLIRCNSQGDTLWTKSWGFPNNDKLFSMASTGNGVVVAGYQDLAGFALGAYSKISPNGEITANNQFTGFTAIIQDTEADDLGNLWLAGSSFANNNHDFALYQFIGQSANPMVHRFSLPHFGYPSRLNRLNDGSFILSGASGSNLNFKPQLMRVSPNFDTVWTRRFPDFTTIMGQEKGALSSVSTQNLIFFGFTEIDQNAESKGHFMIFNQQGNWEKSVSIGESGNFGFLDLITNVAQKPVFCGYASVQNASFNNAWLVIPDPNFVSRTTINSKRENILLFPNPVQDVASWNNQLTISEVKIYASTGQCLGIFKIPDGNHSLNMSGFPSGIYQFQLMSEENAFSGRLIKE